MTKTVFATFDADGAPIEIHPGSAFTTHSVIISSNQEAAWTFSPVGSIIPLEVNHASNALDLYADEDLARFRIAKLTLAAAPAGKQLGSYAVSLSGTGGIILSAVWVNPPPPPVPFSVPAVNAKLALAQAGYHSTVEAIIAQADEEAQIWWSDATVFQRDHPMVATFGAALGLTSAQIDDLFRLAAETV